MSQQQPPPQQQRKNHDMNKTLLVGIHNQYHPSTNETPPHGKPHVKVKKPIIYFYECIYLQEKVFFR